MELENKDLELLAQEFKTMLDEANVNVANLSMMYKKEKSNNNILIAKVQELEEQLANALQVIERYDQQNLAVNN